MTVGCSSVGDTPTITEKPSPSPIQELTPPVEPSPTLDPERCYWGQSPEVVFDATVMTPVEEEPIVVRFTDKSTAHNWGNDVRKIISWKWNFGDGTSSKDQNPQHTYSKQGTYNVSLRVRDSEDCTMSAYQNLFLTPPTGELVSFPDPNLELLIRDSLMMPKGDIYESHLEQIVQLRDRITRGDTAVALPLADLDGIQYCSNLKSLILEYAEITDISILAALSGLESLNLAYNEISDLSPLSGLTNLTDLNLNYNQVSDLSPLTNLTNLTNLDLYYNRISDISPLLENTALGPGVTVFIRQNPLNDESINVYIPQLEERGLVVIWRWD